MREVEVVRSEGYGISSQNENRPLVGLALLRGPRNPSLMSDKKNEEGREKRDGEAARPL